MVIAERPEVASSDEEPARSYRVIGTRPVRPDGVDKVTGRAMYGADVTLPRTLHGKVLRSPYAHARIVSIDTREAEAVPGVCAVVTGKDFPRPDLNAPDPYPINTIDPGHNVLAYDKVLYRGHAVAAVAAVNKHVAEEAAALIRVEYEPLPPVLDVREAMCSDAPLLHSQLRTRSLGGVGESPSNIASYNRLDKGDIDEGFAQADVIVEREFTTQMVHQGYVEPHACSANWSRDGQLTIYCCTQGAFAVRQSVADMLKIPVSRIKVVPTEIGGGFGGKLVVYLEPVAALLSKKSGRPVKMQMSRADVFEGTGPTSGTYMRVKMGARADGTLVAGEAYLAYEAGAYPGSAVGAAAMCIFAAYDIPHQKIDAYDVVVNKPKTVAYRAPGAPAAAFAAEQVVDELSECLGIDPLQFRLLNASREGTVPATGRAYPRIGNVECVQAALRSAHYQSPLEGANRGRGVASGFWFNGAQKSSALAAVNPDGTVNLIEGSVDIGGSRAAMAMQLGETLGIPMEDVRPQVVDTDSIGHTDSTGGSRTTFATGHAVYEVGLDIIRQVKDRVAVIWEVDADSIRYADGLVTCDGDESKRMTFKEFAAQMLRTGAPIEGRAAVAPLGVGGAFSTHICDVEVDPETGKATVLRYTIVQDAGTAIHPSYVEGQMHGGVAQGVGWALNEEYIFDQSGRMLNASYLDYRVPTTLDLPMIEAIIVEVPNPGHPFGVRGVGEVPIVPPLATVANAMYRATGIRFNTLPMSPDRVLSAMHGWSD